MTDSGRICAVILSALLSLSAVQAGLAELAGSAARSPAGLRRPGPGAPGQVAASPFFQRSAAKLTTMTRYTICGSSPGALCPDVV